ncbi:molybdate ABC transporter substrate-binding protein [Devosia insulae DS-56]|uniref:Molybdate ABC transporter substrate-binding protein n=1 Tax=Devosia insulae DS-56 TaxID=1116389 RepID=A0A1E5XUB4_9HYPH|nr:substrate-binding domain-containing protein [Devosia insulae]OEO32173.1 molybdate ABC transporter substrate-binding protein [Devosia insulae DS-56]
MSREIRLVGAIAVRPAILALIPEFEAATGYAVAARWELNPIVKQQIEASVPFDLVVINPNLVADLAAQGKLEVASQVSFGRIAMGVAARAGGQPLDLGSVAAFERTLQAAASIAYANEGTSGSYFIGLLEQLGIANEVRPKLVPTSGGQTAAAVARGEAELAVIPVSSILAAAPDVVLAGRFPSELQSYIDFAVGISTGARDAKAARVLSAFLTSAASDEVLAAKGLERR